MLLTLDEATQRLQWALRIEETQLEALRLSEAQIRWLGTRADEVIIGGSTGADVPLKRDTFMCQECGKTFTKQWRTRPFKYCSSACKQRHYRKNRAKNN